MLDVKLRKSLILLNEVIAIVTLEVLGDQK